MLLSTLYQGIKKKLNTYKLNHMFTYHFQITISVANLVCDFTSFVATYTRFLTKAKALERLLGWI